MVIVLVIAGIGAILAGLVAILYGVALELSLGNSLIVAGTIGASSGLLLLGLAVVLGQLKGIARLLAQPAVREGRGRSSTPAMADEDDFEFTEKQPRPAGRARGGPAPGPPSLPASSSWPEETPPRRRQDESQESESELASAAKPRRNLLFASASRKERDRAQARSAGPSPPDPLGPPLAADAGDTSPTSLEDAWLKMDRSRPAEPPPRRSNRMPLAETDAGAARGTPRTDQPGVTVLKSGVVDGMAYSLYSDGSIEAQMPEGMMRFASLDELTAHIERRA
ncbi:MAG: DUF308 domain-containing protein [Bradyrhizobium sp.]|uniref:DUF308 domain-containing protein n=1 Tax=Bradyrhizobium sp. TaxID=376 RepID=UPI001DB05FDD|nr:DUF308 domain-containing protein [Bradyrhizobium sp.]MBV9562673.1 DUF308 domain-containing protein [Bradyrhizobium sp.]